MGRKGEGHGGHISGGYLDTAKAALVLVVTDMSGTLTQVSSTRRRLLATLVGFGATLPIIRLQSRIFPV